MKVNSVSQLREIYGFPSGRAKVKSLKALDPHAINYISKSPFMMMATMSIEGAMDNSPRGGAPGFIKVLDDTHIVIPDAKGNRRLDSLVNIVETARVGLFFMLPGIDETLRVNGSAYISTSADLLEMFNEEKNPPQTCLVVEIEEIFLHCAKALMRSKLWSRDIQLARDEFPTMGRMLKDQLQGPEEVETHEEMVKRYEKDL